MPDAPQRKAYIFKGANFERLNEPAGTPAGESEQVEFLETDVRKILQGNVESDKSIQDPIVAKPWRVSQRTRDYLIGLAVSNLFLLGLMAVLPRNPITVMFAIGGMAIITAGLTWVTFVVGDPY